MKRQIILLVILFTTLNGVSQQLSTAGQSYLKFYKKNIEKLNKMDPSKMGYENEIMQAERQVKSIQKTDPGYDVTSLSQEIATYREKLKAGLAKNDDIVKQLEPLDQELDKFLSEEIRNAYTTTALEENFARISKFQTEFDNYITNKLLKSDNLKFILPKIESEWQKLNNDPNTIVTYNNSIKNYTDIIAAENYYNKIKLINVKWSLVSAAFPQSEILKEAVNKSNEALKIEGGKEGIIKLVKANKIEVAKKVRMTPAVTNDASTIAQITTALKESSYGKQRTIVKVNVLSSDWSIKRNELTGIILHRYKYFEAALKNNDGSCVLLKVCWYQQDHNGSGYSKGYITQGELHEMMCENVNK